MEAPNKKTRILILTSATGGGHNARAHALKSWFNKLYPESTEVRIEELIENSAWVGKFGVNLCNWIDMIAPVLHYVYWPVIEIVGQINRWYLLFGKNYYETLLRDYQPQLIISVHDFLNYGYFEVAKKLLGKENVACVTYCGEFSGGFGYSINWTNAASDLFIARNDTALSYAHDLGIKKDKSMSFSSLLGPIEYEERFSEGDKEIYRKEQLGLSPNKFTIFLATGNNGQNNHIAFLDILKTHSDTIQAIAICGKNEKAYQELIEWKGNNREFMLYAEGYSNQVHKLIQASDVIVTRGGANTAAKALFYGCPILFNCTQGKMPQEKLTTQYFTQNKAAHVLNNKEDFNRIIETWKEYGPKYQETLANIRSLQPSEEDPAAFIHDLLKVVKVELPEKSVGTVLA